MTSAFAAAVVGALFGGFAVRLGWTRTADLAVLVPALMLVPGPHLINGLTDLIDNEIPMALARLGLAAGILSATTAGVLLGIGIALPDLPAVAAAGFADRPDLATAVLLSGIVTCGFAMFYNATWRQIGMAAVGGMAGNGLREIALGFDAGGDAAAFLGGLAVGLVSSLIARRAGVSVAVIAFAGAVTMMPGLPLYKILGGAVRAARPVSRAGSAAVDLPTALLGPFLIVVALTLGLILGIRAASAARASGN